LKSPGRKIHLAVTANAVGILVFYVYYRYLNPDPDVSRFWKSGPAANMLYFALAALPFLIFGLISGVRNREVNRILKRSDRQWSQAERSRLLDYLFELPKFYFIYSFSAWVFEGILWGIISWSWDPKQFGSMFLTTAIGCVIAGAVTALIAYIIADRLTRQEVSKLFPGMEELERPVSLSLRTTGVVLICVVGVLPVLVISYLSYVHAQQAMLASDARPLVALKLTNLAMVWLSVFLTAMAAGWITRSISRPLIRMAELVRKVSARDFSDHIPIVTDDEIGYVSSGLNLMVKELSVLYQSLERKVQERTAELNVALRDLELTNEKIVDSIAYSKRIQRSLMPDIVRIHRFLPQSFFVWIPRDVVGGDIFFAESLAGEMVVVVIDCTGHGIPGALMTMVAASELRRIIHDEDCRNPAEILRRLNVNIKRLLHQDLDSTLSNDGLDASVCVVAPLEKRLTFAGARQDLIYISNSEAITVKGNRHSIGYKKSDPDYEFSNHRIDMRENDVFYLYTDGVIDQFGGDRRLPFGHSRFRRLLREAQSLPLQQQPAYILSAFHAFRGDHEVQDDITIVGFKL